MEMKEIPLLGPGDIEVRVQSVFRTNNGASALLLLYKSARVDMRVLDEVFGPLNWKRSHVNINGSLFCTISVWDDEKKEWIDKQDVGVPSNRDSKKGEASDAFKRAGFNWGIGRELYDAPTIFVSLGPQEVDLTRGKPAVKASVRFYVSEVSYNKQTHSFEKLTLVDGKGDIRYSLQGASQKKQAPQKRQAPQQAQEESEEARMALDLESALHGEGVRDVDDFARFTWQKNGVKGWNELTGKALNWLGNHLNERIAVYKAARKIA